MVSRVGDGEGSAFCDSEDTLHRILAWPLTAAQALGSRLILLGVTVTISFSIFLCMHHCLADGNSISENSPTETKPEAYLIQA
jgi:hypothetical protein